MTRNSPQRSYAMPSERSWRQPTAVVYRDQMVPESGQPSHAAVFQTTHWSLVLTAQALGSPDAHGALARLCQAYWYPLYCCVRRHGLSAQDAEDLTQAFFAKLLEKGQISFADPERGRFRTFL